MNELIKLIKELLGEDRIKTGAILIATVVVSGLVSMAAYFSAISVPTWEATMIDWLKHTLHIALYATWLYWAAGIVIATDIVNIEAKRIEKEGGKADAKFFAISNIFWFTMFISRSAIMAFLYPIVLGDEPLTGSVLRNAYMLSLIGIFILDKITNRIAENNLNKARMIDFIAMVVSIAIFLTYVIKEKTGITGMMFFVNIAFLGFVGHILTRAENKGKNLMVIAKTRIAIMSILVISAYFGGFVYGEIPSRKLGGMPISAEMKTRSEFSRMGSTTEIIHETRSHIYLRGKDGETIRIPQSEVISVRTRKIGQKSQEEENSGEAKHSKPEDKLQAEDSPNQIPENVPEGVLQTSPVQPPKGYENQRTEEARTH